MAHPAIPVPRRYYKRLLAEARARGVPMWRYLCDRMGYESLGDAPPPLEFCEDEDEVHSFCLANQITPYCERVLRALYEAEGRHIQNWSLVDFIWPHAEGDKGPRNLHVAVCKLRKVIPIERERNLATWLPPESIAMIKACKNAG